MPEGKTFNLKILTTAEGSGAAEAKQGIDDLKAGAATLNTELKQTSAEFEALWAEVKGGLMSRVLNDGDKAALSQALEEMRASLESTFETGDLAAFEREIGQVVERMHDAADAADEWNPEEDAARWQAGTAAVEEHGAALKVGREAVSQMANGVAGLALAMATGEDASKQLVTGLTALATIAGGPVVGGLVAGVGNLVVNFIDAEARRKELDLKALAAEAAEAEAAFRQLAEAITKDFGEALEGHKKKVAEFTADWQKSLDDLELRQARAKELDGAKRKTEDVIEKDRREQEMATLPPDQRAAMEQTYRQIDADKERERKFDDIARQGKDIQDRLDKTTRGIKSAEATIQQAGEMRAQADQREADAAARMDKAGVKSDQQKGLDAAAEAAAKLRAAEEALVNSPDPDKYRASPALQIGYEEERKALQDKRDAAKAEADKAAREAETAQAQIDAGKETYGTAEDREKGKIAQEARGEMDRAALQRKAADEEAANARTKLERSRKKKAAIEHEQQMWEESRKQTMAEDDAAQWRPVRQASRDYEDWRAGADAAATAGDAGGGRSTEAVTRASASVAQSAQRTEDATSKALTDIAGSVDKLATAISNMAGKVAASNARVDEALRAVESLRNQGRY